MQDVLKKYFQFDEYETTFKKEIIAGTTNFLTMAYILGVNTIILSSAGMDFNSVFLATAIWWLFFFFFFQAEDGIRDECTFGTCTRYGF